MLTQIISFRLTNLRLYSICLLLILIFYQPVFTQSNWITLLDEDFENWLSDYEFGHWNPDGWECADQWYVTHEDFNKVLRSAVGDDNGVRYRGGLPWKNYSLEIKTKILEGEEHISFFYRFDFSLGTYIVTLNPNHQTLELSKENFGSPSIQLVNVSCIFNNNTWYKIKIEGLNGHIKIYCNGEKKIDYVDTIPLLFGTFGIETKRDACFDDILVKGESPLLPDAKWYKTGGPYGGLGYDIRIDPTNHQIMYVTDTHGGVLKSFDGGESWQEMNNGIITNGGGLIPVFCLTLDPSNPEILWVGTFRVNGVFKSTDGGESWEFKNKGISTAGYSESATISFRDFAIHPYNSDIVFVAGEIEDIFDGITKSVGMIYKSTDGGDNWRKVLDAENLFRPIDIDPENPEIMYAATGIIDRKSPKIEGIFKSEDGGESWFKINEGLGENLVVGFLEMNPKNSQTLYAASGRETDNGYVKGGVFKTTNGGKEWKKVLSRTANTEFTVVAVAPSDTNIVYAARETYIHYSSDAGQNWDRRDFNYPGYIHSMPIGIVIHPENPNIVYFNFYSGSVFKSEDGARTMVPKLEGISCAIVSDIAISAKNPKIIYATSTSGNFVSHDGGKNWDAINYNLLHGAYRGTIVTHPVDPQIIYYGKEGGAIYISSDCGNNWNLLKDFVSIPNPENPDREIFYNVKAIEIPESNPEIIYAGLIPLDLSENIYTDGTNYQDVGVWKSIDSGETWQECNSGIPEGFRHIMDIAAVSHCPDTVYATVRNMGIYKSIDGGSTWMPKNNGLTSLHVSRVEIDPNNSNKLYLGTFNGSGVYKSNNGGEYWEPVNNGIPLVCPSDLLPIGGSRVGISLKKNKPINLNSNYSEWPWSTVTDIVIDSSNSHIVYLSVGQYGVYRSSDGGNNWDQIVDGLNVKDVSSLAISDDGKILYAGTTGGGVYRLVMGGNKAPEITSFYPANKDTVIILEKQSIEFNVDVFDFNNDQLFYQWELNGVLISEAVSSTYIFKTEQLEEGDYYLKAIVTDQTETVALAWLIRYEINDAPIVQSIPDITFNEDDSVFIDLDLYVTDEESDTTEIDWSYDKISQGDSLLINIDANHHVLVIKTKPNWFGGPIDILLTATDQGGKADSDTITVTVLSVNDAPQFTSNPDIIAIEDSLYSYYATAYDVDEDSIKYSLSVFPKGMTINGRYGLIQWLPTNENVGDTVVVIEAIDGMGGLDEQAYNLQVRNTNDSPTIQSTPPNIAVEDSLFTYQVYASDPDDDKLFYSLTEAPSGISIVDTTGFMQWIPTNEDVGDTTVTIEISDRNGGIVEQHFAITVQNVNDAPLTFDLLYPAEGDTVNLSNIYFFWNRAIDVDYGDSVLYHFQYSEREDFSEMAVFENLSDTTFAFRDSLKQGMTYFWRVLAYDLSRVATMCKQIFKFNTESITNIYEHDTNIPDKFFLGQNYPNPFNPTTVIQYQLPTPSEVTITLYNLLGQKIKVLFQGEKEAGYFNTFWDGKNNNGELSSNGIYLYQIEARSKNQDFIQTKKMIKLE
jgi:photosystem II stability/assembly factor-like uncharacterized protein